MEAEIKRLVELVERLRDKVKEILDKDENTNTTFN
jgi:hypothetical protein